MPVMYSSVSEIEERSTLDDVHRTGCNSQKQRLLFAGLPVVTQLVFVDYWLDILADDSKLFSGSVSWNYSKNSRASSIIRGHTPFDSVGGIHSWYAILKFDIIVSIHEKILLYRVTVYATKQISKIAHNKFYKQSHSSKRLLSFLNNFKWRPPNCDTYLILKFLKKSFSGYPTMQLVDLTLWKKTKM